MSRTEPSLRQSVVEPAGFGAIGFGHSPSCRLGHQQLVLPTDAATCPSQRCISRKLALVLSEILLKACTAWCRTFHEALAHLSPNVCGFGGVPSRPASGSKSDVQKHQACRLQGAATVNESSSAASLLPAANLIPRPVLRLDVQRTSASLRLDTQALSSVQDPIQRETLKLVAISAIVSAISRPPWSIW